MEQRDYYTILGVEKTAGRKQIKEAYRRLALQYHPDRNRTDEAAGRMKEINEAYAVLSDPKKREQYDSFSIRYGASGYHQFRESYSEQDIFRGSDIRQVFEEMSRIFGVRGFDEIFREHYGPGYQSFEFRRPGFSSQGFVFHSFPGMRQGGAGGPRLNGPFGRLVKYLLKKQWGLEFPEKGKDRGDKIVIPAELAVKGGKIHYTYRPKSRDLLVTIPPGITDGKKIRLRGMGDDGKAGGEPGDLYITIYVGRDLLEDLKACWSKVSYWISEMLPRK